VRDTGIGLDALQIPLIFEKFYEVQSALNHSSGDLQFKSGGLGLGLATVKAILKAHGTSCEVQSEVGSGSIFSFSLPAESPSR
jgi:two-component system phosphate regulon sensor histidine kinase PhoR